MSNRALRSTSCGTLVDGVPPPPRHGPIPPGIQAADSPSCYTYNTTDTRFESAHGKSIRCTPACSTTEWDGNFLNWATLRRFDAVKRAMIGGDCFSTRAGMGPVRPAGPGPQDHVRAQASGLNNERADNPIMEAGPGNTWMWDVFRWPIETVIRTPYRFMFPDACSALRTIQASTATVAILIVFGNTN